MLLHSYLMGIIMSALRRNEKVRGEQKRLFT